MYAQRHTAIASNPVDGVNYWGNSAKRRNKRHHPIKAAELAAVAESIGERYPVYELMTLFAAYTGPRAEEIAGMEVDDLVFTPGPDGVRARIEIQRAKKRKGGVWISDTFKSEKSRRAVPLPSWLAGRMETYLLTEHPYGNPRRLTTTPPHHCGRTVHSAARVGGVAARLPRWTTRSRLTPARSTKTCSDPLWRRLVYPQVDPLRRIGLP